MLRPKKVVMFPEIGRVKMFLSNIQMGIRIYIFDLKKHQTNKQKKQESKKQKKLKKDREYVQKID